MQTTIVKQLHAISITRNKSRRHILFNVRASQIIIVPIWRCLRRSRSRDITTTYTALIINLSAAHKYTMLYYNIYNIMQALLEDTGLYTRRYTSIHYNVIVLTLNASLYSSFNI